MWHILRLACLVQHTFTWHALGYISGINDPVDLTAVSLHTNSLRSIPEG